MALKKSTGNMYSFVSHTWNPIKGLCPYDCHYCYTKKWGAQKPLHLDERELRVNIGSGNFIFVCSGCDLFHPEIPEAWFASVMCHVREYHGNQYLWHTKNPERVLELAHKGYSLPGSPIVCTTIETNRWYPAMGNAPHPMKRFDGIARLSGRQMLTIEPVMDFDIMDFTGAIQSVLPFYQVNIGADSLRHNLPEPSEEKLRLFIDWLTTYTKVHLKKNLRRLLPEHRLYGRENA
jgi:DNA repair photolyase